MSIVVNNILKQFGSQKAVNHVSFSICKNEIIGFLGPNGAGKSTTMKMITGFLKPDEGSIQICGMDIAHHPIAVRRTIGYLPEHNPLYLDMFVREYLFFVGKVNALKNITQATENIIEQTGLQVEAHKKIGQLSKGYRQRVGLAAALIHNPEVLILDEPTSGLDPNQIIEIRALILKVAQNKTVLFSTHILQEVEALCQRVLIINTGSLVADDNLKHLKQSFETTHSIIISCKESIDIQKLNTSFPSSNIKCIDHYTIELLNHQDNERIIQWLTQHYRIQSLQEKKNSLEDIFKELTVKATKTM